MKKTPRSDLDLAEEVAVVRAIREAERGNHGEIRVHLEDRCSDAAARAERLFGTLGMARTKHGAGVLLFVAVDSKLAAVHCGAGLADQGRGAEWDAAAEAAVRGLERGELAAGLVETIGALGELLRRHVPGADLEGDELPNRVSRGSDDPDAPASREGVPDAEVQELIEIASRLHERDDDEITMDELRRIAAELGIDDPYLQEARRELERRREAARAERLRWKRQLRRAALIGVAVLALLALLAILGQASLRRRLVEVERLRAQVISVEERRQGVIDRYGARPGDPEERAVLEGAENRVGVERRRLDAAAAHYNARAGSLSGRVWATVFGLPRHVPLSSESAER